METALDPLEVARMGPQRARLSQRRRESPQGRDVATLPNALTAGRMLAVPFIAWALATDRHGLGQPLGGVS